MRTRIGAAPRLRQFYWCDFTTPPVLPEFGKSRPVLVLSPNNTLNGHCLVLPVSTDPQTGRERWAHKIANPPFDRRDCWIVCNHLYTVSNARLAPPKARKIPRLPAEEFDAVLDIVRDWLPMFGR